MKKQFHLLFILLTLSALILTACASGGTGGAGEATDAPVAAPTESGPLTAAPADGGMTISKDILLDPANATDADSLTVVKSMYEGLFRVENDQIIPMLAESYTVADDGLDYIIILRSGVTFHDGSPLNADAVISNFNRWFDLEAAGHSGDFSAWASIFGGFKGETGEGGQPKSVFDGAEKVDDRTVLIHLTQPDNLFLAKLNNPAFSIVSPAAFNADYFGTQLGIAGGTGPYKLSNWSDTGLTLEPNSSYWGGAVAAVMLEYLFK
jgi:peptide/nickel transport system substrate-binding protein